MSNRNLILIVMAGYFGLLFLISRLTAGRQSGNRAFFLGNRQSPWYVVAFGMIGTSLSGVTFVSVPGMVRTIDMTYMQMVIGFFFGYLVIAHCLLPLYYKLNLISIYTYLGDRFGRRSYQTGASFFLLSKMLGAAVRLYLVILILQTFVFDAWRVPFPLTVTATITLIWLYTHRGGVRTIVWTDALQTLCLLVALVVMIGEVKARLELDLPGLFRTLTGDEHFRWFEFADWTSPQYFFKQFFSGVFITVVMTGLDQDMMQKNLSCRNLRDARKNMYGYGFAFLPVNFLFLSLGILLLVLAGRAGIELPAQGDEILPGFAASGLLGNGLLVLFTLGIIAAAFSSADSALTALTTSFCIDLLGVGSRSDRQARRTRLSVHLAMAAVLALTILLIRAVNTRSVIDAVYTLASYTYGPLLGLYAFGLFTRRMPRDRYIPWICIAAPLLCLGIDRLVQSRWDYRFGYEMLIVNGFFTFVGLWALSVRFRYTGGLPGKEAGSGK